MEQAPRRPNRNFPMALEIIPETRFSECTTRLVSVSDLHPSERQYHPADHRKREHNPDLVYATPDANVDPSAAASAAPSAETAASAEIKPAQPKPDPSHHGRRCAVCNHPNREAIEGDFLNWRSPEMIAREFNIRDRASIYRHASALNLYAQRKRHLGRVLENIIECSDVCTFDHCDMIIRAVRVYAHLDDAGRWHEPPRTHYMFTGRISALAPARPPLARRSATREGGKPARRSLGEGGPHPSRAVIPSEPPCGDEARLPDRQGSASASAAPTSRQPRPAGRRAQSAVASGAKRQRRRRIIATVPNSKKG
jgi:hypothetical protein